MIELTLTKNNEVVIINLFKEQNKDIAYFYDADFRYLKSVEIGEVDEDNRSASISAAIANYGQFTTSRHLVFDNDFLSGLLNKIEKL